MAASKTSLRRQKIRSKIVQNACIKHVKNTSKNGHFGGIFRSFTSVTLVTLVTLVGGVQSFSAPIGQPFPHPQGFGHAPRLRVATALSMWRIAVKNFRELAEAAFVQDSFRAAEVTFRRGDRRRRKIPGA